MQEPQRFNFSLLLHKGMKAAQKVIYLHRVIYMANYAVNHATSVQDIRALIILIESTIKLINEAYCEDVITGFGLFYTGYFINIVEGPEGAIMKHLTTLIGAFDKDLSKTPEIIRMKVLLVSFHINKRYYSSWNGRQATPPVLLEKIEPTNLPEVNTRHIQNCIMKLFKMSEYLKNQRQTLIRAAMDNISDLCRHYLPEVNLLDFLLDSPALMDLREYVGLYLSVPDYTDYHEIIWPLPSDFVPNNILGEDVSKRLILTETKEVKDMEKEKETAEDEEVVTE